MLTVAEVADMMGYSCSWFYRNRAALEAAGFPRRVRNTHRYSRKHVEMWIDSGGAHTFNTPQATPTAPAEQHPDNVVDMSAWDSILRHRMHQQFPGAEKQ